MIRLSSSEVLTSPLSPSRAYWAYNAMDCAVTAKVWAELEPLLASKPPALLAYTHHRAMQAVALEMMQEGVLINPIERQLLVTHYEAEREAAQTLLDTLANEVWGPEHYLETTKTKELFTPVGKRGQPLAPRTRTITSHMDASRPRGLNASSSKQVIAFFTIALALPEQFALRKTGAGHDRTPSADDKALEKWKTLRIRGPGAQRGQVAVNLGAPFASLILTIRGASKMLSFLNAGIDPDGRMRCSFNVAGTTSGRWSSSQNVYGRGTNLQALDKEARRMFVSDEGRVFISPDLERAESFATGALAWAVTGHRTYLDACLASDLHVAVCKQAWPTLGWSGDARADRLLADVKVKRWGMSYRDMAKRLGHGTNYWGSAYGISLATGVPVDVVAEFQHLYLTAFPELPAYHRWVIGQIIDTSTLLSPSGWSHTFLGRPDDKSTHREAIAHASQHLIGVLLNKILLSLWRTVHTSSDPSLRTLRFHLQIHDSFIVSAPEKLLPVLIPLIDHEFKSAVVNVPSLLTDETLPVTVPSEFKIGWNWADRDPTKSTFADGNPDGLDKWEGSLGGRKRTRSARPKPSDWLSITL